MTGKDAAIRMRMLSQISSGMHVITADDESAGKVKVFDSSTGMLVVEHGYLRHREVGIPIALVETIDRDAHTIRLSVSKEHAEWVSKHEPEPALLKDL